MSLFWMMLARHCFGRHSWTSEKDGQFKIQTAASTMLWVNDWQETDVGAVCAAMGPGISHSGQVGNGELHERPTAS